MNNSVYAKTMENLRKRIKIRVVKNSQDFIKYTLRPTCVNWNVFENMYGKCIIFTITLWLENLIPDYYLLTWIVYVKKYMEKNHIKKCLI